MDKTKATMSGMCRIFSLDAGEIEALALMEQSPQAMFLTDDAAARLVAEQMGFNVHGTIGILSQKIILDFSCFIPGEWFYIESDVPYSKAIESDCSASPTVNTTSLLNQQF